MSDTTAESPKKDAQETPEAFKERLDAVFARAKAALQGAEAGNSASFEAYFAEFGPAIDGLADPEAVDWQQLLIDMYAAGLRRFGPVEMKARYSEHMSGDGGIWGYFFDGLENQI